jgi:homospermidine synthase
MQLIRISSNVAVIAAAAILAIALASCSGSSDSGWVGKYKTEDTQGKPMEITLTDDGTATGTRESETLTGSWKDGGATVEITWGGGENWSTKLTKDGDKYTKTAYKDGKQDGEPVSAEKVE